MLAKLKVAAVEGWRRGEDWWFDRSRKVQTGAAQAPRPMDDTVGLPLDGHVYLPARVPNVRAALAATGIANYREYTFIDIGSGKGRVVFVAAELPFYEVIGVEYSAALHKAAEANVRSLRRGGTAPIRMVHADAATYEFPGGKLVLFLFNPFGPAVMERMLRNLERRVREHPRHVVIVLLWPELASMVAAVEGVRLLAKTRRYEIFELGAATG